MCDRRLAVCIISVTLTLIYSSFNVILQSSTRTGTGMDVTFNDLTLTHASARGHLANQKILILTPLKDAAPWLDEYFENLERYAQILFRHSERL